MMKNIGAPTSLSSLTNVMPDDIQPNAVDLRVAKILSIQDSIFLIDEDQKVHRGSAELDIHEDGYWLLRPGSYEVVMENIITVAEGEAGFVITRSTLNRNGVFLTSGLYDSGYEGMMAGCLHVQGPGVMKIKPGTRIGQYLSFTAETLHAYDGDYGIGKAHDEKYEG